MVRSSVIVVAAALVGLAAAQSAGCASLVGADFDHPSAEASACADGASASGACGGEPNDAGVGEEASACTPRCADKGCRESDECGGLCLDACPSWTRLDASTNLTGDLYAVWGSGPGDVYAGGALRSSGSGTLVHRSGAESWTEQFRGATTNVTAIWGSGTDLYALAGGAILHATAGITPSWSEQDAGDRLAVIPLAIWGSGDADVYLVGEGPVLHSTGGGAWATQLPNNGLSLKAIWGSGKNDIYAVGNDGSLSGTLAIVHSTGDGNWTPQPSSVTTALTAIWGSGPGDVYAVGEFGTILHSTGDGQWTTEDSATTFNLYGIWGSGPSDIYAVGQDGMIVHSDGGGRWTPQISGTIDNLRGVWGSGRGDVFVVGDHDNSPGDTGFTVLHHP